MLLNRAWPELGKAVGNAAGNGLGTIELGVWTDVEHFTTPGLLETSHYGAVQIYLGGGVVFSLWRVGGQEITLEDLTCCGYGMT